MRPRAGHTGVSRLAGQTSIPVIRYDRIYPPRDPSLLWCRDYDDAIAQLKAHDVNSLLALTGVNTIGHMRPYWQDHTCWFRVLNRDTSRHKAHLAGFPADHLVYYDHDDTAQLLKLLHPQAIITGYAKVPLADGDCQLAPYGTWPEYHHVKASFQYDSFKLFPLGWGGVLYPSHVLDDEVKNEAVFTALCPKADDIWLYVMGLRCQAEKRMLTNSHIAYYHTDLLRQYLTRDRLTATNRFGGENDTQLQALLAHYDIRVKN